MIKLIPSIINDLQNRKQSEYIYHEENVMAVFTFLMPKNSIELNKNLIKKIFNIDEEINLVLISHLYLERLLNEIIFENISDDNNEKINSFYKT